MMRRCHAHICLVYLLSPPHLHASQLIYIYHYVVDIIFDAMLGRYRFQATVYFISRHYLEVISL